MWIYYALLSAILWGAGQVVVKKGHAEFTSFGDNVVATLIQLFIIVPLLFISGVNISAIPATLPYAFLTAAIYMTYYYAITKGQVSLTSTVVSGYPLITIFLSFVFLHERLAIIQILGGLLIILGTIILALPEKMSIKSFHLSEKWVIWGIFGAIMVGFAQLFTKLGTGQSDGNTFTFLMGICYVPALLICALFDKEGRKMNSIKWNKSMVISIIGVGMIEVQLIPLNLAFASGKASLVSLVSATNTIFMIVLALKFLKERINKFQFLGLISTVVGILLVAA